MSAGDDDASGRRRKAAASASDGLHGSADGLVSDNDIHLFDLMADDLLDLAAGATMLTCSAAAVIMPGMVVLVGAMDHT